MVHIAEGLGHRVACALLAALAAADVSHSLYSTGNRWYALALFGWLLVGMSWFLGPAVLTSGFKHALARSQQLAIGPPSLRIGLLGFGFAALMGSLAGRLLS